MATAQMGMVIRHLRRALVRQDGSACTDGQLLASFIDTEDQAAFEALVRRHGPMVFGVCRRVARHHHDAEDAFQATFLVLARKAPSVKPRERVANWLHGVALRVAMKARTMAAKRSGRERRVDDMPEPEAAQQDAWCDLQPLLDQELNGLPENYRLPILLCDLEGKSIKEATRQLGWPQGTLAGRLARGRKLLARRLANRGVALSAGSLAAVVAHNAASAAVPTALVSSTVKTAAMIAAGQAIPSKVAILMEGALKVMLLCKLKTLAAGLLLVAVLIGTAGTIYRTQAAEQRKNKTTDVPTADAKKDRASRGNLDGVWTVVSVIDDRRNRLDIDPILRYITGIQARVRNVRLTLAQGGFALKTGFVSLDGWYVLDSSATPREIVLNVNPDGDDALMSLRGTYALDGDNLTISLREVPAAALNGKTPGVCYTLRREAPPKEAPRHKTAPAVSATKAVPAAATAADEREYVILSTLMEAGAGQPKEVLCLPKLTVDDNQLVSVDINDGPQNLLEKVVVDEKLKIGTFLDVRVKRLGGNKVRLVLSCQRNEVEKSSVNELRVLGNSVQTIQDVELHGPVKVVLQKDARGSAQRWVEITVDEQAEEGDPAPAPAEPK
jgi:RNA polymerase sigma factor (sigma-70 family)